MEMKNIKPEGLWMIYDINNEAHKNHIDNVVCFPFELTVGDRGRWFYVNWDGINENGGKSTNYSTIQNIDADLKLNSIKIETRNSVYHFRRVM